MIYSTHPGLILIFAITILIMLSLDLGVFNKRSHDISSKEAIIWSLIWISLSMLFSMIVYYQAGTEKFFEFQAAYWVEKSLSVDNLFVFILVFNFFNVENRNKHKVLFWGIIGALVLRAIFIFSGTYLVEMSYLNSVLAYFNVGPLKYNFNIIMSLF